MTKQEQSEYISALQKECRTYYDDTLKLKDELAEAAWRISLLEKELSRYKLEYARLKEKYVRGLSDEQRGKTDTDSTI